jgi:hypothetical protein
VEFYLGTDNPSWLERTTVPLFVSHNQIGHRKRFPRSFAPWVLDSGAFQEIGRHGQWTVGPKAYAASVRLIANEVGMMRWAAIQDWMCEPEVLLRTGKKITEHQQLTAENYLDLLWIAPEVAWTPVLQGWYLGDYLRHVDLYGRMGIDLTRCPVVGVGSVCRRQGTREAAEIIHRIGSLGIRVHAFGYKTSGIPTITGHAVSSDSMAWSFIARTRPIRLKGHRHKTCNNCFDWAMIWRRQVCSLIS